MSLEDMYLKTYKYRHRDWSGGQRKDFAATLLKDNESQVFEDAVLDQKGTLYPCAGHEKRYGSDLVGKIAGMGYFMKSNLRIYLLIAIGGSVYYDDLLAETPALVLLSDTFTESYEWSFCPFGQYVYICNGKDKLRRWDGIAAGLTELSAITYIFSDLEEHNSILWGVEHDSSRVRYSNILDGDTWGANNFIDFDSFDADTVRYIQHFQSYLAVFKANRKALLTGDQSANYAVLWLDEHGAVGHHAVTVAEKYLVYVAKDGIRITDLTTDITITEQMADDWTLRVNQAMLSRIAIMYWRNYILVSVPIGESTINNELWCYDLRYKSWAVLTGLSITCWAKGAVPYA